MYSSRYVVTLLRRTKRTVFGNVPSLGSDTIEIKYNPCQLDRNALF